MTNKRNWTFDAAGRLSNWLETLPEAGAYVRDQGSDSIFDGDGRPTKKVEKLRSYNTIPTTAAFVEETKYRIHSSVTGAEITELNETGGKTKTNIYLHGKVIAEQRVWQESESVTFKFGDPIVGTEDLTLADGTISPNDADLIQREPLGAYIPTSEAEMTTFTNYGKGGNWLKPETGFVLDGAPVRWSFLRNHLVSMGEPVLGNTIIRTLKTSISYEGDDGKWITDSEIVGYDILRVDDGIWDIFKKIYRQVECDTRLARIFGDEQAVVGTIIDSKKVRDKWATEDRDRRNDPSENPANGFMHIYGNSTGTSRAGEAGFVGNLFAPPGFTLNPKADKVEGTSWDLNSNLQLIYKKGSLKKYGYNGELTISMVHSGPLPRSNRVPVPIASGVTNGKGSVLIGTIGADGSPFDGGGGGGFSVLDQAIEGVTVELPVTPKSFIHSHAIFYKGAVNRKNRIDPRSVFCKNLGF